MIYIYQVNSDQIRAEKSLEEVLLDLPKSMYERALRYRREEDAFNFVLGRLLLKKGLEELGLGEQLEKIQFQKDGKPYLDAVYFNISHSDNLVVCALSKDGRIGIDVEKEKELELENFKSWFTNKEWNDINNSPDPLKRFYGYWTRKESIIKALGVNLSYLHEIELDAQQDFFLSEGKHWYLEGADFGLNFFGAVCSEVEIDIIQKKIN